MIKTVKMHRIPICIPCCVHAGEVTITNTGRMHIPSLDFNLLSLFHIVIQFYKDLNYKYI